MARSSLERLYTTSQPRRDSSPGDAGPLRVVTVASNKGGVGKTTVAANLAVYLRALREDLPILLVGLDDQVFVDRMFALDATPPDQTILAAIRQGTLAPAIRLGQYGVHYVPSSCQIHQLKSEVRDASVLQAVLARTQWPGLVIIDTKSDLEILTAGAIAASDLAIVPVADRSSLEEAGKIFELLDQWNRPHDRARVLLSLVDLRIKYGEGESRDILALLLSEIRRRGYPLFESFISRSPKIESLYTNPKGRLHSILHGAIDSVVHRQMVHLATDVLRTLGEPLEVASGPETPRPEPPPLEAPRPEMQRPEPSPPEVPRPEVRRPEPPPPEVPRPEIRRRESPPLEFPRLEIPPPEVARSGSPRVADADRRRNMRRIFECKVPSFRLRDPPVLPLRARDLSGDGMGIDESPGLQVGERVHVAVRSSQREQPFLLWARVVRADADRMALRFELPDPYVRQGLTQLLEDLPTVPGARAGAGLTYAARESG